LFLNSNILYEEKELYFKQWIAAGIIQVRDVLHEVIDGFMLLQGIIGGIEGIGEEVEWRTAKQHFDKIKKEIPKEWIKGRGKG